MNMLMLFTQCPRSFGQLHVNGDLKNNSVVVPFGAHAEDHPISAKDQARLQSSGIREKGYEVGKETYS